MRRAAFTIVELTVALAVSTIVLVMIWSLYRSEHRRFDVDQNRLAALQAAVLFDEHLAQDLDRIAIEYDGPATQAFTYEQPVRTIDNGRGLEMRIYAADDPSKYDVQVDKITYAQDKSTGEITRSSQRGGVTRFPGLVVDDPKFSAFSTPLQLPAPAGPGDMTPARGVSAWYVKYVLSCISPEVRARPPEQRPPEARVTLVGAIPLVVRGQRAYHWYWRPNRLELLEVQ